MAERFETLADGRRVSVHTLRSAAGLELTVTALGATVLRLVPGEGAPNVVLGHASLDEYLSPVDNPSHGATIGRFADRIAGASFDLDGVTHHLTPNQGTLCLHGGTEGFSRRIWDVLEVDGCTVALGLESPDGDQGFPGALRVSTRYEVAGRTVTITMQASTSRPTVVSLTNHSYFNLAGEGTGTADGHVLTVPADNYLPTDDQSVPTGEILSVQGTPFDLRAGRPVGDIVREDHQQIRFAAGLDHVFVLPGAGLRHAARVEEPVSGRRLDIRTDAPAIHAYTANHLTGRSPGPSGRLYRPGDGLALETEAFPDAPNQPRFPSTVLRPGQTYSHTVQWEFSSLGVTAGTAARSVRPNPAGPQSPR